MTITGYLKDKIMIVLLNGIGVFLLSLYLVAIGNSVVTAGLISLIWGVIFAVVLAVDYHRRSQYFQKIDDLMVEMDKPYLIQEFLENSWRLEDQLYKEILHRSNKAVIEQIYQLEQERQEYREFIEGWIHEVKLPITGMRLACHNDRHMQKQKMELYLSEMDHAVEQVLFYARSEQVYKDYQISEADLKQIVLQVISKNKYLLIQNQMSVQVPFEQCMIHVDKKWLEFILIQVLINAVKYKKANGGEIIFGAKETANGTSLSVRDAGIGIPAEEAGRIFEKGFTGSNGRSHEKSTGIGLYLCKKLCRKLAIEIKAESIEGEFTEISFFFPKNSYLTKL